MGLFSRIADAIKSRVREAFDSVLFPGAQGGASAPSSVFGGDPEPPPFTPAPVETEEPPPVVVPTFQVFDFATTRTMPDAAGTIRTVPGRDERSTRVEASGSDDYAALARLVYETIEPIAYPSIRMLINVAVDIGAEDTEDWRWFRSRIVEWRHIEDLEDWIDKVHGLLEIARNEDLNSGPKLGYAPQNAQVHVTFF